nr:hypothetical protein [Tanacetum cinerariifolium]
MLLMQAQENGVALDEEQLLFIAGRQDNVVDEDVDEQPVQDLALNVDNVFQADDCDAFDCDVDDAPTAHTMFMANLSFADLVYDEADPSYDSGILSEIHDHDHYQDAVCEHHEVHEMHDDVQPNYVVDSHADYTSSSNMIPYDQYPAQHVSITTQNHVVDKSLTVELTTYKEQVELYERRPIFELTEREQKIDEQLRIVITDRNIKEENLKKKLHYVKMQLQSTINHNKLMVEEVTSLKKDFKQKENKYLEEFLDMKAIKEKAKAAKPVRALTVYPPNTPVKLVPRTCKTRITPTGLTEGERGFEQTKECYLTEVIPFFKMLKEYFKGIQKALTKEIKEMKAIFDELEAKVDQNAVNKKYKIQKDDHDVMVKRFSNLEVQHLNLQLKYQHLKESLGNNNSLPAQDGPDFDSVFEIKKLKASIQGKDNAIIKLRTQISQLQETRSEADRTLNFRALYFQITQLIEKVLILQEQNKLFRVENAKVKQHYKKLYDPIKITRAKHIYQTIALLTKNENLKVQIKAKLKCVTIDFVTLKVFAPGMYDIDVEPIPSRLRNNREVHLDYLKHLKKSVKTLREIVEEAKVERPLDRSLAYACLYTKHSQELLEYEKASQTSNNNTRKHVEQQTTQKTYVPMIPSTGVNSCTNAGRSKPRSNIKKNRISPATSVNRKTIEDHPRTNKSNLQQPNRVDSSISSKRTIINSNSNSVCQTCNKCFISINHDMCVIKYLNYVNASSSVKNIVRKVKQVWKPKPVKQVWKATGKVRTNVGYQWKPTGRIFTLGEQCPLTRHKVNKAVPAGIPTPTDTSTQLVVSANQLDSNNNWGSKWDRSRLRNFVKKFIGTVRFRNNHFGAIIGYGDYVIGDSVISRVYYVEGLGHNLFFVGQFCDSDLEVAFRKHSCYVRDTDGVELIKGSRSSNLYTILVEDIMKSSPIRLLSKASKTKSWLWHRRLNHLNFGTINDLARKDLV